MPARAPDATATLPAVAIDGVGSSAPLAADAPRVPFKSPDAPSRVAFVPANADDRYLVAVHAIDGTNAMCATPCALDLRPGYSVLDVSGSGAFRAGLNVGYGAVTYRLDHRMVGRTVAYLLGGAVTAAGVYGAVGGLLALTTGTDCHAATAAPDALTRCESMQDANTLLGVLGLSLGTTALIIGPLILAAGGSAREVTVLPPGATTTASRGMAGVRVAGFGVGPTVGGAAASLRLEF